MSRRVLYFLGGPADLTKKVMEDCWRSGDTIRVADALPTRDSGDVSMRLEYVTHLYQVVPLEEGLCVAIYVGWERECGGGVEDGTLLPPPGSGD